MAEWNISQKHEPSEINKGNRYTINDDVSLEQLNAITENAFYAMSKSENANNNSNNALSIANSAKTESSNALNNSQNAQTIANQANENSNQALTNSQTAIETANQSKAESQEALSNSEKALNNSQTALSNSSSAISTAESAETKADTAITTANGAKTTAEGIDAKATTALANSQTAVSTANTAETKAQEALDQVVGGLGTKVYRETQLLPSLDIKPIEDDIANNATAINNEATTRANAVNALDNAKVDKVAGKQLSTEDFTTAEKTKLAGLSNYNDTQVKADITALQTRATNIEIKNNEQDSSIDNINDKFSSYLKITDLINKIYPVGSIYLSINNVSPASFIGGTWEQLPANKALWLVNANAGAQIPAGLPNITGTINNAWLGKTFDVQPTWNGALQVGNQQDKGSAGGNGWQMYLRQLNINANKSNAIYGSSTTVQPPAYTIYGWRRIS